MYTQSKDITISYDYEEQYVDSSGHTQTRTRTGYKTVTVNVNIHDEAFNHSVSESVDRIEGLTGAIVGFKVANVAAKKANEQAIADRVTNGFMNMIEQNINLQSAGMEADMHALAGELTQQCKELENKHDVMNKDFNRIKSRYSKLFETINKEFRNRMQAIIKPCFDFVDRVKQEQDRRAGSSLLSMATVGGRESDTARIAIQASKMKRNAAELIAASRRVIDDNRSLHRVVATFAEEDGRPQTYFAPAVVACTCSNVADGEQTAVYLNPVMAAGGRTQEHIVQQLPQLSVAPMEPDVRAGIAAYFDQQLEQMNDGTPQARRIVAQMKSLFDTGVMQAFA